MKRCGRIHDVIFIYSKTEEYTWNTLYTPYTAEYLESEYRHVAPDGRRYKETDLTAAKPGGDVEYEWRVKRSRAPGAKWEADLADEYKSPKDDYVYEFVIPYDGRYWGYSKANLIGFAKDGHLIHRKTGMPRLVQYADDMPGIALQDLWDDIPPVAGKQDLGYPTQKPVALLERIVTVASNEGDVVLDPFCGCGTTIHAAQKLKRQWLGIDVTPCHSLKDACRVLFLASLSRCMAQPKTLMALVPLLLRTSTSSSGGRCRLWRLSHMVVRKRERTAALTVLSISNLTARLPKRSSFQ